MRRLPRLVLAGLVLALGLVSAAPGADGHPTPPNRPTIVLVHGAWADSSSWAAVIARLQRDGFEVYSVPNPLRGLQGDAAATSAFLASGSGPVVLVGHSYGGAVITNAAAGDPHVMALVYVNAFIPDEGESVLQLAAAQPGSALAVPDPSTVFRFVSYPGAPPGDADAYVLPSVFPAAFANDLPLHTARVLAATQRPVALGALAAPSGPPAWRTTPSWALVGTEDHVLPPAEQLIMAERAGATVVRVPASHLSMVSQPKAVADLIEDAASSVPSTREGR
jgi:pimeloyl-ACP methyl ester carboxylesterase